MARKFTPALPIAAPIKRRPGAACGAGFGGKFDHCTGTNANGPLGVNLAGRSSFMDLSVLQPPVVSVLGQQIVCPPTVQHTAVV